MKKNKIIVLVIVILVLTSIIQLLYFNNRIAKKQEVTANSKQQTFRQKIELQNIIEFYKQYDGELTKTEVESNIYTLINTNINILNSLINNKSTNEFEKVYNENKELINSLGVNTIDDFVLISEEIKNAFRDRYIDLKNAEILLNDDSERDDNYYSFGLVVNYSNDSKISFNCKITKTKDSKNSLICTSNSEIARIYKRYNGNIKKTQLITTIEDFINSMKNIHEETASKNLNQQGQYYSLNKEKLHQEGIISENDFKSIAYEINTNISWNDKITFSYYTIDLESYREENGYDVLKIKFDFDQTEEFELHIGLSKNSSIPNIKIYGQNGDL